ALNNACPGNPTSTPTPYRGVRSHGNTGANAVEWSNSFRNGREDTYIDTLEVDIDALLTCIGENEATLLAGSTLDTTEQGGFVLYLSVKGNDSAGINNYGVRVRNGKTLRDVHGLTIVSDQALYVQGDYNSTAAWKPAAFIADSFNVLS